MKDMTTEEKRAAGIPLTHKEIAGIMGLSVDAVKRIEYRALKKLSANSNLRQFWEDRDDSRSSNPARRNFG